MLHLFCETENRFPCSRNFIGSSDYGTVWRIAEMLRSFVSKGMYGLESLDAGIENFYRLGFRRLYHKSLSDDEREVHGRRMHPVVQKPFCDVKSGATGFSL